MSFALFKHLCGGFPGNRWFLLRVWNAWRILRDWDNNAPAVSLQPKQTQSQATFLSHSPPAHQCNSGAPRSVISTSMERHTPHVWNFRHQRPEPLSLFTSMSRPETQHSTVYVWDELTLRQWTAAARSTGRAVMKSCFDFFIFLF